MFWLFLKKFIQKKILFFLQLKKEEGILAAKKI
jgi:hypothetical protein